MEILGCTRWGTVEKGRMENDETENLGHDTDVTGKETRSLHCLRWDEVLETWKDESRLNESRKSRVEFFRKGLVS